MRIPTSETNDTLDAASLPPTEGTELDYRTRPDIDTETRFTIDALTFAVGVAVVARRRVRFLVPDYLGYAAVALLGLVWWVVPDATRPDPRLPGPHGGVPPLARRGAGRVRRPARERSASHLAGYLVAFPCAVAALVRAGPRLRPAGRRLDGGEPEGLRRRRAGSGGVTSRTPAGGRCANHCRRRGRRCSPRSSCSRRTCSASSSSGNSGSRAATRSPRRWPPPGSSSSSASSSSCGVCSRGTRGSRSG